MRRIWRWAMLPPDQRRAAAEASIAIALSAAAVAMVPFRTIVALVETFAPLTGSRDIDAGATVALVRQAIARAARHSPWRAQCFEQGLAAHWMLRRRRVRSTVFYGVAKAADGRLLAHVWVRAGSIDVVGCANAGDFSELLRFPTAP